MSQDFDSLREDVIEANEKIREEDINTDFVFLEDFYVGLNQFLLKVLESLEELCEDDARPKNRSEDIKDGAFKELQRVRRIKSALESDDINKKLYFLLEDIKLDLNISLNIGLEPEHKFLIGKLKNRFRILRKIVFWNIWSGDETELRVISLPRTELRRPLSYSLIVHECFHTREELVESVSEKIDELNTNFDDDELDEVAIDILSLNYMGPVYGKRMVEIPDKIGKHEPSKHPDSETRLGYTLQYIDWLDKESGSHETIVQQRLGADDDYHQFFTRLQEHVRSELNSRQNDIKKPFDSDDFRELQEYIVGLFDGENIPTYATERYNMSGYLGMPEATPSTVLNKLNKYFLKSDSQSAIALPVKPILMLNLLLLVEDYEKKDFEGVILSSFKKWFVTRRTREVLT